MAVSITAAEQAQINAEVAALRGLSIEDLRAAWRGRFGKPPPPLRSRDLLRRSFAETLQVQAFGGDPDLDLQLAAMVRAFGRGQAPTAPKSRFKAGTVLMREHAGVRHRVDIGHDGFTWNGRMYASLSAIAREITGVRWNGPKFFGLRDSQ